MYNDVLDELMNQLPKEKIKEAQEHLTQKQVEKIGLSRTCILKVATKFKYNDPNELLKTKNIINLDLEKVFKFIEDNVHDDDKILIKSGTKIPIEDSILCINDCYFLNAKSFESVPKVYFYSEQAYNKSYIYIYIKGTILNTDEGITPLVLITVKLKDGSVDVKFHKNIAGNKNFIKKQTQQETISDFLNLFIGANLYITKSLEDRNTIYRKKKNERKIANSNSSNKYKYNKNKIIVMDKDKIVYEIDSDKNLTEFKRTYIRHVESWTVRSFDRHYKSGKVVHINAHTRGNKSVKADKKEYTLK